MEVTTLLAEVRNGNSAAMDKLAELLYPELKAMARRRSGRSSNMGATTLVSETFLRMLSGGSLQPEDRQQFFGLAATLMRRIIVDEVRRVSAGKRKGREVSLVETIIGDDAHEKAEFLLHVDEVLSVLESEKPRLARVFECRYFAGLTTAETAAALDASERTVERLWSEARSRVASLLDGDSI